MIKIIDKYLIKQFLMTMGFALIAFLFLFVLIDIMEKIGNFIDQGAPLTIVVEYYLYFLPDILRLMIPVAALLAALFTASKMSNFSELTAITAGGISLYRFMLPFLVTAFIISIFSVYFGGYIVPVANKNKIYIERVHFNKHRMFYGSNVIFQDSKTRIVSIAFYDLMTEKANRISIQDFDSTQITKMISRIDAANMYFDSSKSAWTLKQVIKREFNDTGERVIEYDELKLTGLNFIPQDIISKQQKPEEMTLEELQEFIETQKIVGNDPTGIEIEYHSRISFAFATVIVMLFGLPISANKRRSGIALQFGINLLIAFIYLGFSKISQALGKNGVMEPIYTAWLSNFLFLVAAFINIYRVPK